MKKQTIRNIKEKDHVADAFLVTRKETGVSKTGKPYLILRLMDSTGEAEARAWENAEALSKCFDKDDVVHVRGFAVSYKGGLQINVSEVTRLAEDKYSLRDFLPASKRDPEEMIVELDRVIAGMRDANIRGLMEAIFADPDVRKRFMTAPAAKAMHHPYLGGLLEHVLSICGLVDMVAAHYGAGVNKDLLLAGAILHDIGKIYELSYDRGFDYTDEGKLVGHITIGIELVDGKLANMPGFPRGLAVLIKHMILSHHGQLEFGSPKRPKIIEAIILSYLDDMDAKVQAVRDIMEAEGDSGSNWTTYQRIFERAMYKGERFFEDEAEAAPSAPAEPAPVDAAGPAGDTAKPDVEAAGEPDLFTTRVR